MKGETFYRTLLLLYPKPFRVRFGAEMIRFYRDCYPATGAAMLWGEALKDLFVSAPREWRREICREDSEIDYTGLADTFICSLVVGTLLLGWGVMGATFARNLEVMEGSRFFQGPAAGILFTLIMFATALLVGVLGTLVAARSGRVDSTSSKLINDEGTTARLPQ